MKLIISTILFLFSVTCLAANSWLSNTVYYYSGTADPSSSGPNALIGSTYFRTSTGDIYEKIDDGPTNNWKKITGGGGTPGGSDSQIQVNRSGAFGGASLFTIDGNNFVKLGTTTQAPANPQSQPKFYEARMSTTAGDGAIVIDQYANGSGNATPGIIQRSALGTIASPLPVTSGTNISSYAATAWNGTAFSVNSGANPVAINYFAAENWGSTNWGTGINFGVTPVGSTTRQNGMVLQNSGNVNTNNTTGSSNAAVIVTSQNASTNGPTFSGVKARGAPGAQTVALNGDSIVSLLGSAFDGTSSLSSGQIFMKILDGSFGPTSHGTQMVFQTTNTGSTTKNTSMTIEPDGSMTLRGINQSLAFGTDGTIKGNGFGSLYVTPGSSSGFDILSGSGPGSGSGHIAFVNTAANNGAPGTITASPLTLESGGGNIFMQGDGGFGTEIGASGGHIPYLQLDAQTSGNLQMTLQATTTSYGVVWPAAQGTGALTNDGSGNLSWQPGGANVNLSNVSSTDISYPLNFQAGQASITVDAAAAPSDISITAPNASNTISHGGNLNLTAGNDTSSGSSGGSIVGTAGNGGNLGGAILLQGGIGGIGAGGGVTLQGGNASVNGSSGGAVSLIGGNSLDSGPSTPGGSVILTTGTGGSARGTIKLQDGSQGTVGQVWNETNVDGSGAWTSTLLGTSGHTLFDYSASDDSIKIGYDGGVAFANPIAWQGGGSGTLLLSANTSHNDNSQIQTYGSFVEMFPSEDDAGTVPVLLAIYDKTGSNFGGWTVGTVLSDSSLYVMPEMTGATNGQALVVTGTTTVNGFPALTTGWQSIPSPSGTLCGWHDSTGTPVNCQGTDPATSCPTGYTQSTPTATATTCVAN